MYPVIGATAVDGSSRASYVRQRTNTGGNRCLSSTMTDHLAWFSIPAHQPRDRQLVYVRVKGCPPKKVTFYARPTPRWEGSSIVYDFQYFAEWAALEAARKSA